MPVPQLTLMLAVTEILAGNDVSQRKFEQKKYKW